MRFKGIFLNSGILEVSGNAWRARFVPSFESLALDLTMPLCHLGLGTSLRP